MAQRGDRKLTTNERLDSIINGPEDEDDNQLYLQRQRKAKAFIQRARLYGCGARAKIPTIQRKQPKPRNPFSVSAPTAPAEKRQEDSAVPPGSHEDLYRLVYNSRHDPFYTSTSMTEGIRLAHQPAWYLGSNNSVTPSDSTLFNAASRYGFRGARDIHRYNTAPYESAYRTRSANTPAFLVAVDAPINEWVPPMVASPTQTVNNMESPKLWPENTRYAFGSKLRERPSSQCYRQQTTVGGARPEQGRLAQRVFDRDCEAINKLNDFGKLESSRLLLSRPMASQLRFETTWGDAVRRTANSTLRATMSRELPPCQKHGLLDESDTISSSLGGSMSVIVHSQSSQEIQYRFRLQQHQSSTPHAKCWRMVCRALLLLRNVLKRDQPLHLALEELSKLLQIQTRRVVSGCLVKKVDFLAAFRLSKMLAGMPEKQLSQLYSVFDHNRKNLVRYAAIVAPFCILDQQTSEEGQLRRMAKIWDLYAEHSDDLPPKGRALAVVTAACGNADEFATIKMLFERDFEPASFHLGLTNDYASVLRKGKAALSHNSSGSAGDYASSSVVFEDAIVEPLISDLPVSSICGSQGLTREVFIALLVSCPELLSNCSTQYRARYLDLLAIEEAL